MIPLSSSSVSRPEAGSSFASSAPSGVVSWAAQENGGLQRALRRVWGQGAATSLCCAGRPHREPGSCSRTTCPWHIAGCEEWEDTDASQLLTVSFHWGFQNNRGLDSPFLSQWKISPIGTTAARPSGGRAQGSSGLSARTRWHWAQQMRGL